MDGVLVERLYVPSRRFRAHSHDEFVISLNGPTVLREDVRLDRLQLRVGSDAVTVYNPHQVQSSVTETVEGAPWELFSLHVTPERVASITGRDNSEFVRPVSTDPRLATGVRRIFASSGDTAREWAVWTIAEAFAGSDERIGSEAGPSSLVEGARRELRRDLSGPVRLEELAGTLGISTDRLARAFVAETGFPPYTWHLQLRLLEGRRRLRRKEPITSVAAELGFADQAHLHRHYLAAYGRTPGRDVGSWAHGPGSFKT